MKFIKTIFVASIIFTYSNFAFSKPEVEKAISQKETYEAKKVWLAIPLGAFIGFGLGHATQDRYRDYGWVFTGADTVAFIYGISVLGDCRPADTVCEDNRKRRADTATAIWLISRAVQVTDLSIWGYKYYHKFHPTAFIAPTNNGAALVASISF
jgi:hypothetical protein